MHGKFWRLSKTFIFLVFTQSVQSRRGPQPEFVGMKAMLSVEYLRNEFVGKHIRVTKVDNKQMIFPFLSGTCDCVGLVTAKPARSSIWPPLRLMPRELKLQYTLGGKVGVRNWYIRTKGGTPAESYFGLEAMDSRWSMKKVDDQIAMV